MTEKEVRQIQTQFPRLEELHLLGAGQIEPSALKLLMRQESLKRVVILDAPLEPKRNE